MKVLFSWGQQANNIKKRRKPMKGFTKKRFLGIPAVVVAVSLAVILLAGGVLAAYSFTSMSVEVIVDEPLQVQYKLDWSITDYFEGVTQQHDMTTGWLPMPATGLEAYFSAGDAMTLSFMFNNRANSPLQINTVLGGNVGKFNYGNFPGPQVIPASNGNDFGTVSQDDSISAEWASGAIDLAVKGDAEPGTYNLTIEFEREDVAP